MRSRRQRCGKPSLFQYLAHFFTCPWITHCDVICKCLELFATVNEYGVPTSVKKKMFPGSAWQWCKWDSGFRHLCLQEPSVHL